MKHLKELKNILFCILCKYFRSLLVLNNLFIMFKEVCIRTAEILVIWQHQPGSVVFSSRHWHCKWSNRESMSQGSAREVAVCLCVYCSIHRHYHRTQGRSPINSDTNTFCLFSPPSHLTLTILFYYFIIMFLLKRYSGVYFITIV